MFHIFLLTYNNLFSTCKLQKALIRIQLNLDFLDCNDVDASQYFGLFVAVRQGCVVCPTLSLPYC